MFQEVRLFQDLSLGLMPLTSVTDCSATGAASSVWPDAVIKNCGNAVKNVEWSVGLADGSKIGNMESASSYSGQTNPDTLYKYGVDMDFMGCTVTEDDRTFWVAVTDARCSAVPTSA